LNILRLIHADYGLYLVYLECRFGIWWARYSRCVDTSADDHAGLRVWLVNSRCGRAGSDKLWDIYQLFYYFDASSIKKPRLTGQANSKCHFSNQSNVLHFNDPRRCRWMLSAKLDSSAANILSASMIPRCLKLHAAHLLIGRPLTDQLR
jgi:hypothetical protein